MEVTVSAHMETTVSHPRFSRLVVKLEQARKGPFDGVEMQVQMLGQ